MNGLEVNLNHNVPVTGLTEEELIRLVQDDNLPRLLDFERIEGLSREAIGQAIGIAASRGSYDMLDVLKDYYLIGTGELSSENKMNIIRNSVFNRSGSLNELLEFLVLTNEEREEIIEAVIEYDHFNDFGCFDIIRLLLKHGSISETSRNRLIQIARERGYTQVARSLLLPKTRTCGIHLIVAGALGALFAGVIYARTQLSSE